MENIFNDNIELQSEKSSPQTLLPSEYWISPDAITIELNALDNPQYLQVSLLAESVILAYRVDVIGYDASYNFRRWVLQAYNNFFDRTDRAYVYAQLEKEGSNALIIYSYEPLLLTGTVTDNAGNTKEVYNVYLATISPSSSGSGELVSRYWEDPFDTGRLSTDQNMEEEFKGEWAKMFRLNKVTDMIEVLKDMTSAVIHKLYIGARKILITDIHTSSEDDLNLPITDETLPTTKYVDKNHLSKTKEDETNFLITFFKGLKMGKYTTGLLGTGGAVLIDENGNSHAEFDYLNIRKKALFTEITVQELKHIGGALIISPASMIISSMEEIADGYKCYFNRKDSDGKTIYNEFEVGDQGRCQTFNLEKQENGQVGNRYWWRLVTAIGDDYVVFSKTDADTSSDIPKEGDQVSQLGNRNDPTRQNAQIYSAYGSDAPSRKMYQGINSYSLVDKVIKDEYFDVVSGRFKERTYGDAYIGNREGTDYLNNEEGKGLEVSGTVHIKQGSTGASNLTDLPDEVYRAVKIGGENLLRNTGFDGNYEPESLASATRLNATSEMFSPGLKYWSGTGTVIEEQASPSGYACQLGDLKQSITLTVGESYVAGYWAKGTSINISYGETVFEQPLTGEYQFYVHRFENAGGDAFRMWGNATVYAVKLERGTIQGDWCPNFKDDSYIAEEYRQTWPIQAALKGSTQIYGGLNLTTMIMLGEWVDGIMKKVNAGISGIYNEDTDIAYWAGGTYEQAIATVQKILTGENPTEEEWKSLAKFVVTHGGDVFIRGYIYAMGGYFRGVIDLGDGVTHFEADGTGWIGKNEKGEKIIVVEKDAVDINAILHARKGSTIGNLTISESGSLYGFSSTIVRAMSGIRIQPYTRGELNSFVKDNISTASTFYLVFNGFTNEGTYDIYLPNANNFLSKKPEMTEGVLTLTFIVPTYYMTESVPNEATLNLKPESGSYIYDSNGNTLDMITLSKGNTLELMASIMPTSFTAAFVVNYYIKSLRQ